MAIAAVAFIGVCFFLLKYIVGVFNGADRKAGGRNEKQNIRSAASEEEKQTTTGQHHQQQQQQQQQSVRKRVGGSSNHSTRKSQAVNLQHPWLVSTLKGHEGSVLDLSYSSNGKYLVSSSQDCTVMLWDVRDPNQKNRKSVKCNIRDYGVAHLVRFIPNGKGFVVCKANNECEAFKLEKSPDGGIVMNAQGITSKVLPYDKGFEEDESIVGLDIACTGKYVATCSTTSLVIWDMKGNELSRISTESARSKGGANRCCKISPCGKFISICCGRAIKMWEVMFNSSGEFEEIKAISGLPVGDYDDVAYDQNTSHMALVSQTKNTWEMFYTNVEFRKGTFLRLKVSGLYAGNDPPKVALSPDSHVVAVASGNRLSIFSTLDADLLHVIEDVESDPITAILFDSSGKYLLESIGRYVRVFHNVLGHRGNIIAAREKLKEQQTSATKERLQQLIADSENFLKQF